MGSLTQRDATLHGRGQRLRRLGSHLATGLGPGRRQHRVSSRIWVTAFQTAWINAITAALNHMKAQSYASKIAYVRIGGGAGGEVVSLGLAGLLTIPGGPTTVAALKTLWINSYMAAVESAIVALGSGFHFVQAVDGGFATESVPYNWCDAEATLAVSNGFGIGCEGLKGNDISAFAAHGTTCGG